MNTFFCWIFFKNYFLDGSLIIFQVKEHLRVWLRGEMLELIRTSAMCISSARCARADESSLGWGARSTSHSRRWGCRVHRCSYDVAVAISSLIRCAEQLFFFWHRLFSKGRHDKHYFWSPPLGT